MSFRTFILLMACFGSHFYGYAQQYSGASAINPTDSFYITASALTVSGDLFTGSIVQRVNVPGGSGLPNLMPVGEIVLRKLEPDLTMKWQVTFPGSKAHIMSVHALQNGDVLMSGAYRDTIHFSPTKIFYAEQFRANAFVACYDNQGVIKWVYTTTPHPNYSKFFVTFDVKDGDVYLPYSAFPFAGTNLLVLDDQGDSINNILLSNGSLLISEFEFDSAGNVYLCGTGDPQAQLGGEPIGTDSTIFGYSSFVGKLDTAFDQIWSDLYKYVTVDLYPSVAFTANRVAFLVDTMPQPNGIGNYHMLKFYTPNGMAIQSDSIGPGIFSRMHRSMALESFGDDFMYASISGFDTITINKVDQQFNHQRLATVKMNQVQSRPWMIANDSVLYYNHSFSDTAAVVNQTDTVFSSKPGLSALYNYQQILVKFKTVTTIHIDENRDTQELAIFPNPTVSVIQLSIPNFLQDNFAIELVNTNGLVVKRISHTQSGVITLAVSDLPAGIYMIRVIGQGHTIMDRFIKL